MVWLSNQISYLNVKSFFRALISSFGFCFALGKLHVQLAMVFPSKTIPKLILFIS
jgi:hypothetical protein